MTEDNLRSLEVDSVTSRNGLEELGIAPARVETVVPGYLGGGRRGVRIQAYRRAARRD